MSIYYVYAYLRKSDGTPYYIGKGKGNRAFRPHTFVSVPDDRTKIVFLEENLEENRALELEIEYIKKYGRRNIGTGILHNLTDGGESTRGMKQSDHQKKVVGDMFRGKPKSNKHKMNLSKAWKRRGSFTETTRRKLSEKLKLRMAKASPVLCPHCNKEGQFQAMRRWHFDNCRNYTCELST